MIAMKSGFLDKLIERLGRIGPEEVQNYLLQLAQEKGLIETVFNAIQEGIIVTDAKGRITYVNDAACELFGLEAEKAIGKRLDERVRGLDWKSLSNRKARSAATWKFSIRQIASSISTSCRSDRATHAETKMARDSQAEPVGHAIILRDITESRRSTEKTIESERFNALTLLAAGVAHEIGNPLNSLHIHLAIDGAQGAQTRWEGERGAAGSDRHFRARRSRGSIRSLRNFCRRSGRRSRCFIRRT